MVIPLEQRTNPHARDSNRSLRISAIIQATFVMAAFSIGAAVLYVWLSGDPVGMISILCFILGAGIGAAVFFPLHFRYAKRKRAEFISVGGDPTGITLFMFGAMGGRRLPDGSWEWYGDHVSSGDSSSAM
jgi:hypothetical protein